MKRSEILIWTLRLVAALILFQSLFFKYSGSSESVYIFSKLGVEPWGRIMSAVIESLAVLLLLIPATSILGALIALGMMTGAILAHLTRLGIVVFDDHGQLFIYACLVFFCSLGIIYLEKRKMTHLYKTFKRIH